MAIPKETHRTSSDAIESGDTARVDSLIRQHPILVNHPDWTPPPLHCAILWNKLDVAKILLDNAADIEMTDPDRGATPLQYAVVYCKKDFIPILLSKGASVARDGGTVLDLAKEGAAGKFDEYDDTPSAQEYEEIVELLISLGVE